MASTSDAPELPPVPQAEPVRPSVSPAPEPKAKPERKGGGALVAFMAGLVGGVIGALLISFVPLAIPGTPAAKLQAALGTADLPQLAARVSALEHQASALPPGGDTAALSARLQTVEKQIAAIDTQVGTLAPGANPAVPDDGRALAAGLATSVTEIRGRLDTLSNEVQAAQNLAARLAALETRVPADLAAELAALAAKGDVTALQARVAKLEANTSAYDAKRAAGAVALANLARAAESGAPFTAELAAVKLVNVDPALVDPLAPFAVQGVRPLGALAADFPAAAREALRAQSRAAPNWWTRLWASITGLFIVRSEDARSGSGLDAVLSRAGAAARGGNLQGAVAEVSRVRGPAATALAPWRAQAQARIALDAMLTKLSAQILADLHS